MAAVSVLRARLREHLRDCWTEFSRTVIGDIVAAAVAVCFITLMFLACSLALIALFRGISLMFDLAG
jgi:uncharacterized membrane protein